jgi:micrococcal nuclease
MLLAALLGAAVTGGAMYVAHAAGQAVHAAPATAAVNRVVDGDTLAVGSTTVRLIGIDTPESVRPGTPVECGANASSRALARLVAGDRVHLVTDPTQDRRDRYGRLLAYVVLDDGRDVQAELIKQGWATTYVYDRPFRRVDAYRRAEAQALAHHRGVYGSCGGDFHRSAS